MLAQQRQQAILELVQRRGGVRVADLVREFGVSDMTIRRDLEVLSERGLVTKVHGGATTVGTASTEEPGFAAKSVRQRQEKEIQPAAAQRGPPHARSFLPPVNPVSPRPGATAH